MSGSEVTWPATIGVLLLIVAICLGYVVSCVACRLVQGKQNDSSARAEFASYKLRQRDVNDRPDK